MIDHKITVNKRVIEYNFAHRHENYHKKRVALIKDCIKCIRRLQNNPTQTDLYDNPAHINR